MTQHQAQIRRLEDELADAQSRCTSAQQEAEACKAHKDIAERDEGNLAFLLHDIASQTGFDARQPITQLPDHVRAKLATAA